MSTKRSRVITIAAAGTLTLATAISLAATLPAGSAAPPASANAAYMIAISRQATAQTARPAAASAQVSNFSRMRAIQAKHEQELAAAERKAAARAAARKAAAAKAAARKAAEQAAQQAVQQPPVQAASTAQTAAQAQPVRQPAVAAPSGSPEQVAEQMLSQFGWSSSQFSCLQPLWQQESGWSVTAENPTSGAYGIAQALPGSKMATAGADWQTDAATQIRWGLGYIQGQYGSPCGAWAHEQATGWY